MWINFLYNTASILNILVVEYIRFIYSKNYDTFIHNIIYRSSKINICYIKFFQACASNEYLDETINKHLIKFTDNVPYTQDDIDKDVLHNIQKQFAINLFETDDPNEVILPINSGTISLVFVDKTRKYAIKMKRRNIDEDVKLTIDDLNKLVYLFSFVPYLQKFNIGHFIQINILKLNEQLDFRREIDKTLLYKNLSDKVDYFVVPNTIPEITAVMPNVIVMDYMDGYRLENIKDENRVNYSKIMLKIFFLGTLNGFSHGDLHSGNILFTEKNGHPQIILLDFGIIMSLTNVFSELMSIFMSDMETSTISELSDVAFSALINTSSVPINILNIVYNAHIDELKLFVSEFVTAIKEKEQFNVIEVVNILHKIMLYIENNQLQGCGIKLNNDYYNFSISILMVSTIINKMCNTELLSLINEVFKEMFQPDLFD